MTLIAYAFPKFPGNMVNRPKYSFNLNDRIFTKFIDHS